MLSNDIATGILSVFDERDCDYLDGLPIRIVDFTEDEKSLNIHLLSNEVSNILGNNSEIIEVGRDNFIININSVDINCRMNVFYDDMFDGMYNIKEFIISEIV